MSSLLFAGFPTRDTVAVTGPDAVKFLNSLLSQDIVGLAVGAGAHALLLQPQGKLDVDLRVLRTGAEECRLDCEAGFGPTLVASLRRFKIRVKADVTDTTAEVGVIPLRGERATGVVPVDVPGAAHAFVSWPTGGGSPGTPHELLVIRADWPAPWASSAAASPGTAVGPVPGVDLLGAVEALASVTASLVAAGAVAAGADEWEAARVAAGVPRQGRDIDERTIPQEAFLERSAVSFTKGCFLGQELVCRIDSRGHVNRFLCGFEIDSGPDATTPAPGAVIVWGGKEVGMLTTVTATGETILALGYIRREVDLPTAVVVGTGTAARTATAVALNVAALAAPSAGAPEDS